MIVVGLFVSSIAYDGTRQLIEICNMNAHSKISECIFDLRLSSLSEVESDAGSLHTPSAVDLNFW